MMNKTTNGRSALLALLLLCLSIFILAVPKAANAAGIGNARVIDEMNLLSDVEVQKLDAQLAAVEQTHRIRILAAIVGDWKDKPLKPLAENIIKTIAPGGEHGAVLLLLSPENNTYYVATDAKLRTRITDEGIEHLTEKFLPAFESKKYADMFTAFGQVAGEMLTYYEKEGEPYDPANAFNLMALGIALACALILGGTIYYILYECGGNVTSATEADAYLNQDSFTLTQNEDNYLYTTVTREAKEKKESSSGSNVSTSSSHGGGGKF